uniref:Uncharacterized protein n=1 Tax=Timema poppense TaxID=170557 RepID=A0A7R9DGY7_TIMPO|nr:unnamed protein product [Timema poppensis]
METYTKLHKLGQLHILLTSYKVSDIA